MMNICIFLLNMSTCSMKIIFLWFQWICIQKSAKQPGIIKQKHVCLTRWTSTPPKHVNLHHEEDMGVYLDVSWKLNQHVLFHIFFGMLVSCISCFSFVLGQFRFILKEKLKSEKDAIICLKYLFNDIFASSSLYKAFEVGWNVVHGQENNNELHGKYTACWQIHIL